MTLRRDTARVFAVLVIATVGIVVGAVGVSAAVSQQTGQDDAGQTGVLADTDSHAPVASDTNATSSTLDWPASSGTIGRTSATSATGSITRPVERWRANPTTIPNTAPVVGDVDGDGSTEVVVVESGSNDPGVTVFEGAPGLQTGSVEWKRFSHGTFLASPAIGDVDGDGGVEIVVGRNGTLSALDGATGAIEWNYTAGVDDVNGDPVIEDVDADGTQEILAGADRTLVVVEGTTGASEWTGTVGTDDSLDEGATAALGDIDGDEATEVVVGGTSDALTTFDGATGDTEWTVPFSGRSVSSPIVYRQNGTARIAVGTDDSDSPRLTVLNRSGEVAWESTLEGVNTETNPFAASDVDDDGKTELAFGDFDGVTLFENGTEEWSTSVKTMNDVAVAIADIDGDGNAEVLGMGDTQYAALSGSSGDVEWTWGDVVDQRLLGKDSVAASLGDADDDDDVELVVDNDRLQVLDGQRDDVGGSIPSGWPTPGGDAARTGTTDVTGNISSPAVKWNRSFADGPGSPAVADVDGDDSIEVVVTMSNVSADRPTFARALNGTSGTIEWRATANDEVSNVDSPSLGDVDGDGTVEVVTEARIGRGSDDPVHMVTLSGTDGQRELNQSSVGSLFDNGPIADVDGDGTLEMVLELGLHVLEGPTGALEWSGSNSDLAAVGDLDRDGTPEVVIGDVFDVRAYEGSGAGNGSAREQWSRESFSGSQVTAVAIADTDADGATEVVVGRDNGSMATMNGTTGATEWQNTSASTARTHELSVGNLDRTGPAEVVATCDRTDVCVFDGSTGSLVWRRSFRSGSVGPEVATRPALGDVDGDGTLDVVAGIENGTVFALDGETGDRTWQFDAEGRFPDGDIALADVDGDDAMELVFSTSDSGGTSGPGTVYALDEGTVPEDGEDRKDGVDRFRNENGVVDAPGLLDAAAAFRSGEIDATLLLDVAAAFRSGESAA